MVLTSASLVGLVLLVWLDRSVISPRRIARSDSPERAAASDKARYHGKAFRVRAIMDGDTVEVDAPDGQHGTTRVRLLGIDAPEMNYEDHRPACFAEEATAFTRTRISGRQVTVHLDEGDRTRCNYGRLLAYLELDDGTVLNEALLTEGYAYADLRFKHSYFHKYGELEASARALRKGLWAEVTRDDLPDWLQRMRPNLLAD
ncbi:MAG: thermonuclease family protein [Sedimentisphaerales bacterium]|jgi:micrococcal nuclease|nr:thermonuclease family protein [Sedimentisphaerales bacterium]HNY79212.1 thermonuclease family protein [Sedimentisphaerales bacterium]HOC61500.1 thermonuclease family protein [Sedimentisphaerales bacterium]HOH65236.1 thermonuclease family protein [Sedimentisphaerales bacterium]HPY51974.1 thermonuclease family protein [Sedimentisphaerales bacterium]